jgi:hypothetical protein
MMQNKIYLLLLVVLSIVIQSTSLDSYNRKGNKDNDDSIEDNVIVSGNYNPSNGDRSQTLTNRRDRYSPYGSSANNYRSRSRWSSPSSSSSYGDSSDYNDRSSYGYGSNNILNNFPGALSPGGYDSGAYLSNGPTCHSLLDPIYPLFSDICGSVPQARYSLPNAFGHLERWQIAQILTIILGPTTPSSANPVCSRSLRLLLCPLLFPPCPTRYEAPPVLPCQPFCRIVKAQCAAPSLDLLPCDLLPLTSDLCPINPSPYSSLLSSFMPPLPLNGPLSTLGLPQSPLSSLLAQSALAAGLSPMDIPPSVLSSMLAQSQFPPGLSPADLPPSVLASLFSQSPFPPMLPSSPFPPAPTPPGVPSPAFASLFASSGMPPSAMMPPGLSPPGLSSFFSAPGMPPGPFSPAAMSSFLSPINPYLNPDPYMADSLTPILVDFPPLQYMPGRQQTSRYYPLTRSATEKV